MRTPEEVVRELVADAESLRRRGHGDDAARIERIAAEMDAALEPIRLVPEHTAMVRSGKKRAWLRARFEQWERVGAAALIDGERHYRLCVLPTRLGRAEGAALAEQFIEAAS